MQIAQEAFATKAYRVSSAASRATAEWLNLGPLDKPTRISLEDLNKLRVGAYGNADDDTKEKWCKVMLHLLELQQVGRLHGATCQ